MSHRQVLPALVGAAALATAIFVAPAEARVHAAACTALNNVEAVIDDSGSMAGTDPNVLRGQAVKLIIQQQAQNQPNFTFGGVSFGDGATTLFGPSPVGANKAAMLGSLASLQADDGSTNYGAAFTQAATDNPNRQANIFMTDGGNNGDPIPFPQPPTYVIGFGDSAALPEDQAALQNLATSTGGQYYPQTTSAKLVSVVNGILAQITCQSQPQSFNDTFTKVGQAISHSVTIGAGTKSANFVVSYPTKDDLFTFSAALYVHGKKVAASTAKKHKVKKLKVKIVRSETFFTAHVRGLKRGKLRFKIKAKKLGVSFDPANPPGAVTTQFSPSRKR
ncbi:MAG TPA: vWA domain-containing protein [Thermoleophilaceae bacterium]